MQILLSILILSAPDPLAKLRKAKDPHSKAIRVAAYGFAFCRFGMLFMQHDQAAGRASLDMDARTAGYELAAARGWRDAANKAEKLVTKDQADWSADWCRTKAYNELIDCLVAKFNPGGSTRCADPDSVLAVDLAVADFAEMSR